MHDIQETVLRIKECSRKKKISVNKMLDDCNLNKNTIFTMQSRGSWIQANSLAKIADYLDVSVDYLLGRTNIPDLSVEYISNNETSQTAVHTVTANDNGTPEEKPHSKQCEALVGIFEKLNIIKQAKLLAYAADLEKEI